MLNSDSLHAWLWLNFDPHFPTNIVVVFPFTPPIALDIPLKLQIVELQWSTSRNVWKKVPFHFWRTAGSCPDWPMARRGYSGESGRLLGNSSGPNRSFTVAFLHQPIPFENRILEFLRTLLECIIGGLSRGSDRKSRSIGHHENNRNLIR